MHAGPNLEFDAGNITYLVEIQRPGSGGLSDGAIAGIAVAAGVLLIAIIGLALGLTVCRRPNVMPGNQLMPYGGRPMMQQPQQPVAYGTPRPASGMYQSVAPATSAYVLPTGYNTAQTAAPAVYGTVAQPAAQYAYATPAQPAAQYTYATAAQPTAQYAYAASTASTQSPQYYYIANQTPAASVTANPIYGSYVQMQ